MEIQTSYEPELTADGSWTMRNHEIDECFHSAMGAEKEAKQLYLEPALPWLSTPMASVTVLDVGLGLGYNAISLVDWWHKNRASAAKEIHLVSLEKDVDLIRAFTASKGAWQQNWAKERLDYLSCFGAWHDTDKNYTAKYEADGSSFQWTIIAGDALNADLSSWQLDVVWQDAFSPQKNPRLWSVKWFEKLKNHSNPNVCLFTYSVAGTVKRSLEAAGWNYEKIKRSDATHKKQWLRAKLNPMKERGSEHT